jgi:hypothetical protein
MLFNCIPSSICLRHVSTPVPMLLAASSGSAASRGRQAQRANPPIPSRTEGRVVVAVAGGGRGHGRQHRQVLHAGQRRLHCGEYSMSILSCAYSYL